MQREEEEERDKEAARERQRQRTLTGVRTPFVPSHWLHADATDRRSMLQEIEPLSHIMVDTLLPSYTSTEIYIERNRNRNTHAEEDGEKDR